MPQSYYTGKVDFGNNQYACWKYENAATIINRAIKADELEEINNNLWQTNDSLSLALQVQTTKFNMSQQALSICKSKDMDYKKLEQTYITEINIWKEEAKTQKQHKWYAIGAGALLGIFLLTE